MWNGGKRRRVSWSMRVHASYLRAETLLPLTGFLPQKELRERLRDIAPSGEWTDTSIAFERAALDDPWRMHLAAKFQHAGVASVNGVPGLRGVSGSIAGNENGGQVIIDTDNGVFHWPTQFPKHVDLERLKANIYWKRTAQELLIASPDWDIKTHDAEIRGQLAWHQPSDAASPQLTLVGAIQNRQCGQCPQLSSQRFDRTGSACVAQRCLPGRTFAGHYFVPRSGAKFSVP